MIRTLECRAKLQSLPGISKLSWRYIQNIGNMKLIFEKQALHYSLLVVLLAAMFIIRAEPYNTVGARRCSRFWMPYEQRMQCHPGFGFVLYSYMFSLMWRSPQPLQSVIVLAPYSLPGARTPDTKDSTVWLAALSSRLCHLPPNKCHR